MKPQYLVQALSKMPDFGAEGRYIQMERERARRERDKLPARPPLMFASANLGIFSKSHWTEYLHELDKYEAALTKHRREIKEGVIPFQVLVTNEGRDDRSVWVHVSVENGTIDAKKEAPQRPDRIDEAPETKFHMPKIIGGFVRYGIHVKPHSLEAVFSRLGAHESEYLVQDVLYLDLFRDTSIQYAVRSQRVESQRGEVEL